MSTSKTIAGVGPTSSLFENRTVRSAESRTDESISPSTLMAERDEASVSTGKDPVNRPACISKFKVQILEGTLTGGVLRPPEWPPGEISPTANKIRSPHRSGSPANIPKEWQADEAVHASFDTASRASRPTKTVSMEPAPAACELLVDLGNVLTARLDLIADKQAALKSGLKLVSIQMRQLLEQLESTSTSEASRTNTNPVNDRQMLDAKASAALLGISRSTFFELRKQSGFPEAIAVGRRCIRYGRGDLLAWLERKQLQHAAAKGTDESAT